MLQNLWWAAGDNLVSVPLAAGVLAPLGFVMPMHIVALNAQTLRGLDLTAEAAMSWAGEQT